MKLVMKNKGKIVNAYQLGIQDPMENMLIEKGAIKKVGLDEYELFSQEATGEHGQLANALDYFKVDIKDDHYYPYPNRREWFETSHIHIQGNEYEQIPEKLLAWQVDDGMIEEIQYLLQHHKLIINPDDKQHYFSAFLWGTQLTAASDATVIFYSVDRNDQNEIIDISFNFVAKEEFEANYKVIQA